MPSSLRIPDAVERRVYARWRLAVCRALPAAASVAGGDRHLTLLPVALDQFVELDLAQRRAQLLL